MRAVVDCRHPNPRLAQLKPSSTARNEERGEFAAEQRQGGAPAAHTETYASTPADGFLPDASFTDTGMSR